MTASGNEVSAPPIANTASVAAKLGQWLEEYDELAVILPVLTGLFVTSRFNLRGANALIANLTIAALSRQAIGQLKQEAASGSGTASAGASVASAPASPPDDYTIVHSVSGRIRLRVPQLLDDRGFGKRLEKLLLADDAVLGVRINHAAASIAIQYEDGLPELELGMRLLDILDKAKNTTITLVAETSDA